MSFGSSESYGEGIIGSMRGFAVRGVSRVGLERQRHSFWRGLIHGYEDRKCRPCCAEENGKPSLGSLRHDSLCVEGSGRKKVITRTLSSINDLPVAVCLPDLVTSRLSITRYD